MFGSNTTIRDETLLALRGGSGEALVPTTGAFPIRDCARRRPWTNKCYPLAGTWQIAFLGEIEPRAARPGRPVRQVTRVGSR
jgi:hypothetical protein